MKSLLRNPVPRVCALAAAATLAAACSDSTSPEPDDFEGAWDYVVTNAQAEGVSCDVDGMTIVFTRSGGVLGGVVTAEGDGNVSCVVDGTPWSTDLVGQVPLHDVAESGTSIQFSIEAVAGEWVSEGSIQDHVMTGTTTIFVRVLDIDPVELNGTWTATRQ